MSSTIEQCDNLLREFKGKGLKLSPFIIPRGLHSIYTKILNYFSTSDLVKQELYSNSCTICQTQTLSNLRFQFDIDLEKRSFQLKGFMFLCELCSGVYNLEKMILIDREGNAPELISQFMRVNNIEQSSNYWENNQLVQEIYSIAYSLKVLLANIPNMKMLDLHGNKITESTDLSIIVSQLFHQSMDEENNVKTNKKKKKKKTIRNQYIKKGT